MSRSIKAGAVGYVDLQRLAPRVAALGNEFAAFVLAGFRAGADPDTRLVIADTLRADAVEADMAGCARLGVELAALADKIAAPFTVDRDAF